MYFVHNFLHEIIASLFKKVPAMLRENIQSLSESVFQRKQKKLCFVVYLLFLAAAVGILLLRKSKDRNWGGGAVRFMLSFSPLFKDSVLSLPSYMVILMKSYSHEIMYFFRMQNSYGFLMLLYDKHF